MASAIDAMERQFEEFFAYCAKQKFSHAQMQRICRPLLWQRRLERLKRWGAAAAGVLALWLLYVGCDSFAWSVSAVGRLLLIQLLPIWDWTPLYNARCLIDRPSAAANNPVAPPLGPDETEPANCVLCSMLDRIPTAANVSFSQLEATYLERGQPVIVTDSHAPQPLDAWLALILNAPEAAPFRDSEPCDLANNLMLHRLFHVEIALEQIQQSLMRPPAQRQWFMQLRNCRFTAVKASRLFVGRPYYYPLHLAPFYSSWLLMVHNYAPAAEPRPLLLQGLICVQQLSGSFALQLRPKQPCTNVCPVVNVRLDAGEALLFTTDLWSLSYRTTADAAQSQEDAAVASILEFDWQL